MPLPWSHIIYGWSDSLAQRWPPFSCNYWSPFERCKDCPSGRLWIACMCTYHWRREVMWFSGRWHCDFCVGIFLVIGWGGSACVIRGKEEDSRVFRWRWRDLGSKDCSAYAFINFIDRLYWEARKPPPNSCHLIRDYQRILEFLKL